MMSEDSNQSVSIEPELNLSKPVVIDAARLFGSSKEIQIELDGVLYRLRITRRGKLILQK